MLTNRTTGKTENFLKCFNFVKILDHLVLKKKDETTKKKRVKFLVLEKKCRRNKTTFIIN